MKVLVLGGHGFIGSHVADRLNMEGHDVVIYARKRSAFETNIRWIEGDFLDSAKLAEALTACDSVVHTVSTTVPVTSRSDPQFDVHTNLIGTMKLLELMRLQNVKRLIYLSSGGTVYGNVQHSPVRENHSLSPISSYGAVKVAIENFIGIAVNEWGLQATIFRPSNPYGERQAHTSVQGLVATVLDNVLKERETLIYGDGSAVRDYIYIGDLASLITKSVNSGSCGIFNAGNGRGTSINTILSTIEKITGKPVLKSYEKSRSFDVKEIILDSSKAVECFSWSPETSLDDGIRRYYNWLESL